MRNRLRSFSLWKGWKIPFEISIALELFRFSTWSNSCINNQRSQTSANKIRTSHNYEGKLCTRPKKYGIRLATLLRGTDARKPGETLSEFNRQPICQDSCGHGFQLFSWSRKRLFTSWFPLSRRSLLFKKNQLGWKSSLNPIELEMNRLFSTSWQIGFCNCFWNLSFCLITSADPGGIFVSFPAEIISGMTM